MRQGFIIVWGSQPWYLRWYYYLDPGVHHVALVTMIDASLCLLDGIWHGMNPDIGHAVDIRLLTRILGYPAVSWTLYGLIASQLGDVHDDFITQEDGTRTPVADYIYQCARGLLLFEALHSWQHIRSGNCSTISAKSGKSGHGFLWQVLPLPAQHAGLRGADFGGLRVHVLAGHLHRIRQAQLPAPLMQAAEQW